MGQKVHPVGFRLGVIKTWDSKWFEHRNYAQWLHEDIKMREFVKKSLAHAAYTAAPEPAWPDSPAAEAISSVPLR